MEERLIHTKTGKMIGTLTLPKGSIIEVGDIPYKLVEDTLVI